LSLFGFQAGKSNVVLLLNRILTLFAWSYASTWVSNLRTFQASSPQVVVPVL
jgi:hypothetical protein